METNVQQNLQQAHALLDLLPPAKVVAVRGLLEVMVDEDDEELTEEERADIQAGIDSLNHGRIVPMEVVLADLGLTMADFEKMGEGGSPEKR